MVKCKRLAIGGAGFLSALSLALLPVAEGQGVVSPGFEAGMEGWAEADPEGKSVTQSDVAKSGEKSAKISDAQGMLQQAVPVAPNTDYTLSAWIKGAGLIGVKAGEQVFFDRHEKSRDWEEVSVGFNSGEQDQVVIFAGFNGKEGRFDDFSVAKAGDANPKSVSVVLKSDGGYGLSPELKPSQNFDLSGWSLNTPADDDGDGRSDSFKERDLVAGYEHSEFFYTGADGGLVMKATIGGAKTSKNTKNVRSELREMLRKGDTSISTRNDDGTPNKNNWVFSSAPAKAQSEAGAVDGLLRATLAVNHVTTTGDEDETGVVVIGQIHGKHDEPVKVFYRKMPEHERGSIYISHEPVDEDDVYYNLLGDYADRDTDPEKGIALDEPFSFEINARGNIIGVTVYQAEKPLAVAEFDQSESGYDVAKEFMYFKTGVYNQNSTGEADDYAQATFYEIDATH